MKDFFNRNKPVFIIGFITVAIFLGIIFLSENNPSAGPTLKKIENVTLIEPYTFKRGSNNPRVTLIEFSDFECPACKGFQPTINDLFTKYGSIMQFAYRHFPLPQHEFARGAAIAAQAAGDQGKFWEYADKLFENQPNLTKDDLANYAEEIGLDMAKFKKDIDDPKFAQQVDNDVATGNKIGLQSTPSFILDGKLLEFNSPDDVVIAVENALKAAKVDLNTIQKQDSTQSTQSTSSQQTSTNTTVKPTGEVVVINYTNDGFVPNNLKLKLGTTVKFVNTVDRDIMIRQLIDTYADFRYVRPIKKGESYSVVLTVKDLWTFKEDSMRHYGSIFVSE